MDKEKSQHIMNACLRLFLRYGVKSVTMDDISRELGMSKKTLYIYFKDKNDLVLKVLHGFLSHHKREMNTIVHHHKNAIDQLLAIYEMNAKDLQEVKPMLLFGLKKYYPEAWTVYEEFKRNYLPSCVEDNIKEGIEQGLYRSTVNPRIISLAYTGMINLIFDSDIFSDKEFDFNQLYLELFYYHIRGIASEKGIAYLNKKIDENTYKRTENL